MQALELFVDMHDGTAAAGTLHVHGHPGAESSTFTYSPDWLARDDAFALNPALPLDDGPVHVSMKENSLPGFVRDSSPDRWGRKLAKLEAEMNRITPGETLFLMSLPDASRIGAVRYRSPWMDTFLHHEAGAPSLGISDLPRILHAAKLVQRRVAMLRDCRLLLGQGSPLGGARPKSAIVDADGHPAIAKFSKLSDRLPVVEGEALCADLAVKAGIDAAQTRLVRFQKGTATVVRRFDRKSDRAGGSVERLHYVSALTVLGQVEGQKGSYADIANAILETCSDPATDLGELFRRMVFNILVSNSDDHLRNHGFIRDPETGWRLAPAFDVNPVPRVDGKLVLSTRIYDESGEASIGHALQAAGAFGLSDDEARQITAETVTAVMEWRQAGRMLGIAAGDLAVFDKAFEHADMEAAARIAHDLKPERKVGRPWRTRRRRKRRG